MENFLYKISSYNLLNNMLPGVIFCYLLKIFFETEVLKEVIFVNLFVYYFIGMIIGRIGSIVVEPICKKIGWVNFCSYDEFIKASEKNNKIDILSETANMYRSLLTMFLMILMIRLYVYLMSTFNFLLNNTIDIIIILLSIIFFFSYRKQVSYIKKRVERTNISLNNSLETQ